MKWSAIGVRAAAVALWTATVPPLPSTAHAAGSASSAFSSAQVDAMAEALAKEDFAPSDELGEVLSELTYDQYRDIRFRPDRALWRGEKRPYQVQLFHLGSFYRTPVELFVVEPGKAAQPLIFDRAMFDYGPHVPTLPAALPSQLAGFRVHHPLNRPDYFDELFVFLGASYFRSLGKDTGYGLSARGIAIDTAEPQGEEFPAFRRFWIEKPAKDAKAIVVHALLDGPSVTGAYHFVIHPGENVRMDVSAVLYPRKEISKLGLAPLTSMYLHGENDRSSVDDYRPEVHDSDGLLIWNGTGERLWRPLSNPSRLRVSSFQTKGVKGFGLLQRDRAFTSYEDLEARYDRRPGAWVETREGFEQGSVTLVEIPTPAEIHDNIAVFFVPEKPVEAGRALRFAYRLHWGKQPAPRVATRSVLATRSVPGAPGRRRYLVDFSPLPNAGAGSEPVRPEVWSSRGAISSAQVQANSVSGGARVIFDLELDGTDPVELRCILKQGQNTSSETWNDQLTP